MVIGRLLTQLGLGQSDLVEVTKGTIQRISRARSTTTPQEREAISFALYSMVDELVARDVATGDTANKMRQEIECWVK